MRLAPFLILVPVVSLAQDAVSFQRHADSIEILVDGKPFTTFHYESKWDKPFLYPVRAASGADVTRGFPVNPRPGETNDHVWQRGLWYTHGDIGGVDFWRELGRDKTGRIVVAGSPKTEGNRLSWQGDLIGPGDRKVATMRQELRFSGDAVKRIVDVSVSIRAAGDAPLKMGDTEEGALGFRFSDDFREDRGAQLRNAEGLTTSKNIWGKRSKWVEYAIVREGKKLAVTILDHPANPRHPTWWHARGYGMAAANPFGLHDFEKDKTKDGSLTIPPNGELPFRYRVVIHEGEEGENLFRDFAGSDGTTSRFRIGEDWCFVDVPKTPGKVREAVILIHGNGQTVGEATSSWESNASSRRAMDRLVAAGYLVAQTNHGATPDNGMWGNAVTQEGVVALMKRLKTEHSIERFHAMAMSAGNVTLLNLILNRKAEFASAVLLAPVISLESMYRCPGETERVKGISKAFAFQPASGCPGNPEQDRAFRNATASADPLRRITALSAQRIKSELGGTRWMAMFSDDDPKVLPQENARAFQAVLQKAAIAVDIKTLKIPTHSSDELLNRYTTDILELFAAAGSGHTRTAQ